MSAEKQESTPTTPQHEMRKRQAKRYQDNLATEVIEEWYELSGAKDERKGRKLVRCERTENGVNRSYVGREKPAAKFIEQIKKEGKLK